MNEGQWVSGDRPTATFAMCQNSSGQTIYVNVDLIRIVDFQRANNYSSLFFDKDHMINISGPPTTILHAGKGRAI
jgi:hypothetical protein